MVQQASQYECKEYEANEVLDLAQNRHLICECKCCDSYTLVLLTVYFAFLVDESNDFNWNRDRNKEEKFL